MQPVVLTLVDQQTISHDTAHMQCKLINFVILAMHIFALQTVEEISVKMTHLSSPNMMHVCCMYCRTASITTASTRTTATQTSHNMLESAEN